MSEPGKNLVEGEFRSRVSKRKASEVRVLSNKIVPQ